jgi:hypothetical protein
MFLSNQIIIHHMDTSVHMFTALQKPIYLYVQGYPYDKIMYSIGLRRIKAASMELALIFRFLFVFPP